VLLSGRNNGVKRTCISHQSGALYSNPPGRRHNSAAPISEAVAIGRDRDRWLRGHLIGSDNVGSARIMDAYRQYHRRWLGKAVYKFVAYTYPHAERGLSIRFGSYQVWSRRDDPLSHAVISLKGKRYLESAVPMYSRTKKRWKMAQIVSVLAAFRTLSHSGFPCGVSERRRHGQHFHCGTPNIH
jgi:hypothetical protein